MGGPFNSAWALLKTNLNAPPINQHHIQQMQDFVNSIQPHIVTEDDRYPLTPEEEENLQLQHKAYEMARGANPQPHNMTDEVYEDLIELSGEAILAHLMTKKKPDYPWPKKQAFQTTFLDRGNLSFDPMLSRQRKLNARMARESNRREAVPSQIKISPRDNNRGGRDFSLVNDEGEILSQISGYGNDKYNAHINDFYGRTPEPYRRQGMYTKLMQALIGAGIPIVSNERNVQSDAFHRNFMQNLPPNIEGEHLTEDDGSHLQRLGYQRQDVPQFLDAQGQRSGLNRLDYGAIPIVNQANQARSMDELAEQDRAKIQRGLGHRPEMVGIQVTQPMARNTQQITFDDFYERQNNSQ